MKKLISYIAILVGLTVAGVSPAFSQERPNRVIIVDKAGGYNSYVTDDIAQLQFEYVPGEVSVDVEILEDVQVDYMVLSMIRSEACESFCLDIVPRSIADKLTSQAAQINYVEANNSQRYYNDFTHGEVTGIALEYSTPYSILTVAYDNLGIAAGVTVTNFTTPMADIQGNPAIEVSVESVSKTNFSLRFQPNSDVGEYYLCSFVAGTLEEQFENFGAFMGASNINEFIVNLAWNQANKGPVTHQWDDMDPSTSYDIAMAITDKNGNFIPQPQIYTITTDGSGGTGEAYVEVTPGAFVLADWDGEMLPSQFLTFTPNSETARYRQGIYLATAYDADPEGHNESVQQEAPVGYGNWWLYDEITTDFQMNPATDYVIIVASQNLNNEWGKLNVMRYTTPAEVSTRSNATLGSRSDDSLLKANRPAPNVRHFVTAPSKMKKITITNK